MRWDDGRDLWWGNERDYDCAYPYPCDCPVCDEVAERRRLAREELESELSERLTEEAERLAEEEERLAEKLRRATVGNRERLLRKEKSVLHQDVRDMSLLAQRLAEHMRTRGEPGWKVRFPSREITRLRHDEGRWPYIHGTPDEGDQRTLRCMRMVCDINEWNRKVWRLDSTAAEAWEWHISLPLIFIMEFLVRRYSEMNGWTLTNKNGKTIRPKNFESATDICFAKGVYGEEVRDRLKKARDWRNEAHLHKKDRVGHKHDGRFERYEDTKATLHDLEEALAAHWRGF